MPTQTDEEKIEKSDFSGAVQRKTTKFVKSEADNQVELGINVDFSRRIGGIEKIKGYEQLGNTITTSSTSTSTSSSSSTSTSTSTSTSSSTSTSTSTSSTTTSA